MFKHIYVNSLKIYVREKNTIFWLLIFPMILALFFKAAFSGLTEGESFEVINIAVVETEENGEGFKIYKDIFSGLGEILKVTYTDEEEARSLLSDDKIAGFITLEAEEGMPKLKLSIMKNEIQQGIVKAVLDKINEGTKLVFSGQVSADELYRVFEAEDVLNNVSLSGQKQDYVAVWFYTILGMAAMYGSMLGIFIVNYTQANLSAKGMRINLAPAPKLIEFLAMFSAGATLHSIIMIIEYLYLRYIMNINFGDRQGYIIMVSVIGGITGISVGAMISSLFKASENMKIGICIGFSMVCSYLSGMMDDTVKYKVMRDMPILQKLNPAGLLTDAYLKLFYYEKLDYFWGDVVNLLAIMAVCSAITIFALRRQQYDSI